MDIYLIHGGKLDKNWNVPIKIKQEDIIEIDLINSSMNIYDGDNIIETLSGSIGLGINNGPSGIAQVNAYIADTSFLPLKNLTFELVLKNPHGEIIYVDRGTIYLVESSNIEETQEAKPWDLLNPNIEHVSREERKARLDICHQCPRLQLGICLECGCVMNLKTKLPHASCPLGKW